MGWLPAGVLLGGLGRVLIMLLRNPSRAAELAAACKLFQATVIQMARLSCAANRARELEARM